VLKRIPAVAAVQVSLFCGISAEPDKYFAWASSLIPTGSLATLPMAGEFLAPFVLFLEINSDS
jgi:hypothetical protein